MEDLELGYRLQPHGMRLFYSKAALGHHYHLATLLRRRAELAGPRSQYLMEGDRSLLVLALRHLLRNLLFNRLTVGWFWQPLFAAAERSAWLAACMRENFYRGVVVYHFRKGCRDARRPTRPLEAT